METNTPLNENVETKDSTQNTKTEETVNENTLTEKEKEYLENYKEENSFIKSLSDGYKEFGRLSEKQLLAFRKTQEETKDKLTKCPHTNLEYHQICKFTDKKFQEHSTIKIVSVRPKAMCFLDETNSKFAWVPSKAVNSEEIIDAQTDEKMMEITLKDWFTRDDGFWKESVPYEKKVKPQEQTNTESVKAEIEEEVEKIEVKKEEVKTEYDKQIDDLYSEPDKDDGLPF